jgi:hypothetical protein
MVKKGLLIAAHSLLWVLTIAAIAQAAEPQRKYQAPRTEFGQPDLRGVWNYSSDITPERPAGFTDKEYFTREDIQKMNAARSKMIEQFANIGVGAHNTFYFDYLAKTENLRTSLIVYPTNGRMPKLVPGVTAFNEFDGILTDAKGAPPVRLIAGGVGRDGPEHRGLFERCISMGSPPLMPGVENNFIQVLQNKDYVILHVEQIHEARIIPLDGRPFLSDQFRTWAGDSRGHWEGDTLVVVTKNFNDLTPSFRGAGSAFHKVVTERISRTGNDTLAYEATVEDPATFQDKITVSYPMAKSDERIFEFACHEGNVDMAVMLSGARKQEQSAPEGERKN